MNPCTKNNEEFRGAGTIEYKDRSDAGKTTAFRRVKDMCNKKKEIRDEMMEYMTLGGIHPNIMKGLGE